MGLLRVISSFEVWILVFIVSWGGFVDVGFKVFLMRRMVTRGEAFYNGVFLNKLARNNRLVRNTPALFMLRV